MKIFTKVYEKDDYLMMIDFVGFASLVFVFLVTLLITLRWPKVSIILSIAFLLRLFTLLTGHYLVDLPDSTADAVSLEFAASEFSKEGLYYIFNKFEGPEPRFISLLIAIPYSLFGRSLLMAKSISLMFGVGSVFLGWLITKKFWNDNIANKVGWILALFPSLILYSSLVLREIYIVFFLLIALYGIVDWIRTNTFKSIIITMVGFTGATFFHGAMMVGAIVFVIIVAIVKFKYFLKRLINLKIDPKNLIFLTMIILVLGFYFSNKINVPYLGDFANTIDLENLFKKTHGATRGTASWPEWTKISSFVEILYKGPIRGIYIIFSPFPWDIKEIRHLIGMFDSFLYMLFTFLIISNIKIIWRDPVSRILLIILLSYIFVFGIGVGNFGTGIRHRSKFVVIFILLVAPFLKQLIFKKKKNKI